MKRALVTGGQGFIGRHMAAALFTRGWSVVHIDVAGPSPMDCLDLFRCEERYDLVVHCAARAPHRAAIDGQPATTVYNRFLDAAMFDWAIRTGQRRVLYLSSSAVYPASLQTGISVQLAERDADGDPPPDAYGWAKLAGEQMAECANRAGTPVHVVRPFSGYGEDQGEDWPFGAFIARARRREDPFTVWGDGSQVRDWVHVSDVVAGALAVVEADVRKPVNLCTGVGTQMFELAQMVCEAAGYNPVYAFRPDMPAGVAYRVGDSARMREVYTPRVPLAEGVARAVRGVHVG